MKTKLNILSLTFNQLCELFQSRYGKGNYHASAVYREVYQNLSSQIETISELKTSPSLVSQIQRDFKFDLASITSIQREDELIKFASRLSDGYEIESVIIPMAKHNAICISSQVGCRMGCSFCETGRLGFIRNLMVDEIIGQLVNAKIRFGTDIRNIVFMGMGEPLDNFKNVVQAIRVMEDQRGLNIAKRHITLSTVGRSKWINKLAKLNWPQLKLAVSLNAPNDQIRAAIMPIHRRDSIKNLRQALINYPLAKKSAIFFEYVLIKNVNDKREHVRQLVSYLKPLKAKLNLIPYNPGTGSLYNAPSECDIIRFHSWLIDEGIFVRRRTTKGQKIKAACGQLGRLQFV